MGVGIAVPLDKYEIVEVNTTRISDTKRQSRPPKLNPITAFLKSYIWTPIIALLTKIGVLKKVIKPFQDALWSNNQMLTVRLKPVSGGGAQASPSWWALTTCRASSITQLS